MGSSQICTYNNGAVIECSCDCPQFYTGGCLSCPTWYWWVGGSLLLLAIIGFIVRIVLRRRRAQQIEIKQELRVAETTPRNVQPQQQPPRNNPNRRQPNQQGNPNQVVQGKPIEPNIPVGSGPISNPK